MLFAPPAFPPTDATARAALIQWIDEVPLVYGPWQVFKRLYKEAEAAFINGTREPEILAALLARLDAQSLQSASNSAAIFGRFSAMKVAGAYAYVVANGRSLETYDLSSPAQPQLVSRWNERESDLNASQLFLHEARLWIKQYGKFWLFDLGDPAEPRLQGEFPANHHNSAVAGNYLVNWAGEGSLRVLEVRGENLVEIGVCEFNRVNGQPIYVNSVQGAPGFASVSYYDYSARAYKVQIVDLSDPTHPRLAVMLSGNVHGEFNLIGKNVACSQSGNDLQFYDISNLNSLKKLGQINLPGLTMTSCQGDLVAAFCQEWSDGAYQKQIRFVDVSRPSAPTLLGQTEIDPTASISAVALAGDMLYLSATDGLHIFDISTVSRAQEIGKAPKPETFAYLKRRGRRLLRLLSQTDEAAFCQLAAAFLQATGTRPNLDWSTNWIAADLVAARHPNWYQCSHGRGPYLEKGESLVVNRRVERAPGAWNAHPEALRPLIESGVSAPVVHLARQVCGAQTPLTPAQIESYVVSRWPNLRVLGARAARLADANALSPRAVAGALFALNGSARRELLERIAPSWQIATELANFLGDSLPVTRDRFGRRQSVAALTRRGREIALLLAARFDLSDPAFESGGALPVLRILLDAGEAPLRALGAQFCRRLSASQIFPLLDFAVGNAAVAEALMESASRVDFDKAAIDRAIRAENPAARALAWQLIEASQTNPETLGQVWLSLFRGLSQDYDYSARSQNWRVSSALQSAASDANARACLVRATLNINEVRPMWRGELVGADENSYYKNDGVPGEIFGVYALILPAKTVVSTIATLPDKKWAQWKTPFVAAIAPHATVTAGFWQGVQEYLNAKNPAFEQLRARTFNDPEVAATFAGAAGQLAPGLLLSLIGSVPETVWQSWRASLLGVLQTDAPRREAFWEAARSQSFESGLLRARLIEDAEFAATFGLLESDVLQFDDPALESLLLQWLGARDLDQYTAVEAAIHPLPAVRALGLATLQARGFNVPVALRLLESDLRDAMDAAKAWFEARETGIANLALALCDSPRLRVRDYGREFVGARLEALLGDGLLEKLEENPNAEMQGFVAQLLLNRGAQNREIAEPLQFDRAVLRGRNRARRAKNLVQARRAATPLPDDATLLELARGKTPRDAEWALQQLALRALQGEVEGVEVSGVGAI